VFDPFEVICTEVYDNTHDEHRKGDKYDRVPYRVHRRLHDGIGMLFQAPGAVHES